MYNRNKAPLIYLTLIRRELNENVGCRRRLQVYYITSMKIDKST